ncbi:MAG: hypothetical protein MUP02_06025, partial [Actinobacteria bacterium]|nr:hypothetical protein [Actinomycetota bacterium]
MFLKIKNFKIVSIAFVLFAIGFFYPGVTNAGVLETYVDFSDVTIGSTGTRVLHFTNLTGGGLYAELSFGTCSCGAPFSIETSEIYIGPWGNDDIEVYFTPSSPGVCTAVLYVFYGLMDYEEVEVTGTGIGITTKQTDINGL